MTFTEIHWATQAGYPILTSLQLFPLLAAALTWLLRDSRYVIHLGVAAAIVEGLLAIDLYRHYDTGQAAMQLAEHWHMIWPLTYHAAADGITVLFMLLTALITLLIVLYGPIRGLEPTWRLLSTVFAIEATLMALFATVNLLWFVLLSAGELGLVGYLLWRWSTSPTKDFVLSRFYQFMGTGIVLLLAGTVLLGWNHADNTGSGWTFDLFELASAPVSKEFQSVVFFLLFYGLAIRTPLFPLHGWLPLIAEHGSVAVAPTFLLGLKVGIYGLLRYVFPIMPEAVMHWHAFVVAFAVVGIFYAALLATMQDNLRRLLAFAVVSHTSILVIGLFSLHHASFQGSVMLSVTFGLAIAALLFTTGLVYHRTRTALLPKLGGLFDQIPLISIAFLVASLSIIGMPGTPGFDAVHLILEAAIVQFGAQITIAASFGNVVAAGFLLWAFQRAFLAPQKEGVTAPKVARASVQEQLVAGLVLLVLLGAGFYSEPWLELIDKPLAALSALYAK